MNRKCEIHELQHTIHSRKRYRFDIWCRDFILPSPHPNWEYMVIAGGNVLDRLDSGFLETHRKKLRVIEVDGIPLTVLKISRGLTTALKRAKNLRSFYRGITHIIPDGEMKKYYYDLWLAAHNLEANITRLRELQTNSVPARDEIGKGVDAALRADGTIRGAASHYGKL